MILKPKNLTLSLPAIIIWNTKAREINDSIEFQLIIINLRNCLNGSQNIDVSRNVSNVRKEWPTLAIWWKQLNFKSNQIHFKNEYLGKPSWACLSHRSLEGGTRVQQIIIGYFVAPISVLLIYPVLRTKSYTSITIKILKRLVHSL